VSYNHQGIKAYQSIDKQSDKQEEDPYKVIAILMKNALESINIAKITMAQKQIEEKGRFISLAITLIDGLKASLDIDKGGEIAENLNGLYDYMMARLVEANLKNDLDMLDEVSELLTTVKEGWDGIEDFANNQQED
tara:strand:+ start:88096 stop:88503 length:408 start_codon:yes stop_codon:yes gene_type:complete